MSAIKARTQLPGRRAGSLIGAAFGMIFVVANTGSLPTAVTGPLRVLAVLGFVAVLVAVLRLRSDLDAAPSTRVFGRAYWLVIGATVVVLVGGAAIVNGALGLPQAGVAWTSLVVGGHFLALAAIFGQRFFRTLGVLVAACGLAGFVLVAAGASVASIDLVAGVAPGVILLGFAWWGVRRGKRDVEPTLGRR